MPAEPHDNEPAPDVLSLDLESLRTVDHPVLSALVAELRERVAEPGAQALWGFGNAM
jgi:FXSXX-COOH protein